MIRFCDVVWLGVLCVCSCWRSVCMSLCVLCVAYCVMLHGFLKAFCTCGRLYVCGVCDFLCVDVWCVCACAL